MTASPWIRSRTWDGFWLLSGFWVPTLLLLLPLIGSKVLILTFTLCFWIAHRVSSLYLALCVAEYRDVLAARKGYFFGFPLLLLGLLLVFVLTPESLLPIPLLGRFFLLGLLDYFFSLYHFSVQHYGVLAVYRSRLPHGQQDPGLLKWDWWTCLSVSGLLTVMMDYLNGELNQYHLFAPAPALVPEGFFLWLKLGLSTLVLVCWGLTLRRYLKHQQGIARTLYFTSLCYMSIVSFFVEPLLYFAIVQIQHWFVSLGLTTHMASNSQPAQGQLSRWYQPWAWVNSQVLGVLLVLMLCSLLLTPVLEADYYIASGFNAESLNIPYFLEQFKGSLWLSIFGVLAFFSSFVHYIYDRGVFRFSDPLTRRAALPLLKSPLKGQTS